MRTTMRGLAALAFAMAGVPAIGQTPAASLVHGATPLTLDRIFGRDALRTEQVNGGEWSSDGTAYLAIENAPGAEGGTDLVRYDVATNARTVIVPAALLKTGAAAKPIAIESYAFSPDGRKLLILTNGQPFRRTHALGDYWLLDLDTRALRRIGGDAPPASLMYAEFSPDGGQIAYVRGNNLYVEPTGGGAPRQLTRDGDTLIVNGLGDWVYEEEFFLTKAWKWSPDSSRIAFWRFDTSGVGTFNLVTNTQGQYSRVIPLQYPKAGTVNSAVQVGTVEVATGTTTWAKLDGDPRQIYVPRVTWAPDSRRLLLQQANRLQNTYALLSVDVADGTSRLVHTERDDTWVEPNPDPTWLGNGRAFTWVSERDGWRHVYVAATAGGKMDLRTPGDFDVVEVLQVDAKSGWIWFTAAPGDPTRRYLYRATLTGRRKVERMTPAGQPGTHAYDLAPGGRFARHTVSTFDTAPLTEMLDLTTHRSVRTLASNAEVNAVLQQQALGRTEFLRLDIGGGTVLDAWLIKPKSFDPTKRYPILFEVYGEPWGQTVADRFGGRNALWYRMLAERGYLIASIDPRGTASPRGRAWRRSIYGQVGVLSSADLAAGVRRMLADRSYIDPDRVGIWGWSGGGSMTLNALFRYPDLYKTGIAVAAVADQTLYDTIYQERYMGLPTTNADGYRDGSPINFAQNLKGNLLIIHGTGDDNVHYQNLEQLVDRLVAANKPFQMMAYPDRSHAIYEKPGTSLHLFSLMTRYLEEKLPAGAR